MEEEISLKELILVLWEGRKLIAGITVGAMVIALLVSLFAITPLYEARSRVELAPFTITPGEFLDHLDKTELVEEAAPGLTDHPSGLAERISISADNAALDYSVKAKSPEKANQVAAATGPELFRQSGQFQLDQYRLEREQMALSLESLEEEMDTYSPDPGHHLEQLTLEKKKIEESITQLELYIEDLHGDMSPDEQLQAAEVDPSYRVLMERMGELLTGHAEVTMQINEVERGRFPDEILESDPYYVYLEEKKGELNSQLSDTIFNIRSLERILDQEIPDYYLAVTPAGEQAVNARWQLNTAVAGVLGLMLSVFIVFVRPHVRELFNTENTTDTSTHLDEE